MTGAAAGPGRALVERLAQRPDLGALIGIDVAPARVDGVVWRAVDLRTADLAPHLGGVTALVHFATSTDLGLAPDLRRAKTVQGTARVFAAAKAAGVRRVVLCTSAAVYGLCPDVDATVPDASPLVTTAEAGSLLAQHLEVEDLVRQARKEGLAVTVLRPAEIVGLPPAYDGPLLRLLDAPRLLALHGTEPQWQLCHVEDLVSAVEVALQAPVGSYAVACEGSLPQTEVEALTGKHRIELPAAVALSTAERLHRLGLATSDPAELDHLQGRRVVACDGLRAAGWEPVWSNAKALEEHVSMRRRESRTGAYTAAGATIAVLGTAALVRQARRRRGR